jgi:hypothetical protein
MRKSHLLALATATALAGTSAASKAAVTVTITWEFSSNGGASYSPVVGNAVTIPTGQAINAAGDTYDIGMLVDVTGNPNPAASSGYSVAQPANLGLAAWGFGFTDGNSLATLDPQNVAVDTTPYTTNSTGNSDGAGGVASPSISGGFVANAVKVSKTSTNVVLGYGGNASAELFSGLGIVTGSTSGTDTITPVPGPTAFNVVSNLTPGSSSTAPTYGQSGYAAALLVESPLVITVGSGASTTSPSPHPIVSLAPGGTATYGPQLGSITVVSTGPGGYVPGSTSFASATTGYVVTSTFNVGDKEVYALKLDSNGVAVPTSSTLNATIVADINALGAGSNVSAGLVSGSAYAGLFPGYDILLTSTAGYAGPATDQLDIDFSQDTDTATPGLTVVGAAAVPEPATAAGAVLGAAGLLLGRRKSKIATA